MSTMNMAMTMLEQVEAKVKRLQDELQDHRDALKNSMEGSDAEAHCACCPHLRAEVKRLRALCAEASEFCDYSFDQDYRMKALVERLAKAGRGEA